MIHIGTVDISTLDEGSFQTLYHLASTERQQKAKRYLRKPDAHRCIVADALLRYALRYSLGTDRVTLSKTHAGKPFLPERRDFHFNLSHSGRWVVLAWSRRPVGIDVETVCMDESKEHLARRFYHPDEQSYLFAASGPERAKRFYEIWTKKESYLKYQGTGINRSLSSFSVLHLPEVAFHTQPLEDAVLTLCAETTECQIIPVTVSMLLSE